MLARRSPPQAASALNGVQRVAKLSLQDDGTLQGEVNETWSGDAGAAQRYALRTAQQDVDQIKPVESMLTSSLATFHILNASVGNLRVLDRPVIWKYALEIPRYPKVAGDLLIIRPRVFGSVSSGLVSTAAMFMAQPPTARIHRAGARVRRRNDRRTCCRARLRWRFPAAPGAGSARA